MSTYGSWTYTWTYVWMDGDGHMDRRTYRLMDLHVWTDELPYGRMDLHVDRRTDWRMDGRTPLNDSETNGRIWKQHFLYQKTCCLQKLDSFLDQCPWPSMLRSSFYIFNRFTIAQNRSNLEPQFLSCVFTRTNRTWAVKLQSLHQCLQRSFQCQTFRNSVVYWNFRTV